MVIFIVTPSIELVQRVRELYQKNSTDVRFLIPVLQGLTKVRSGCGIQEGSGCGIQEGSGWGLIGGLFPCSKR